MPETVKNNPLPEFYRDDIASTELDETIADPERRRFQGEFLGMYLENLMVERSEDFSKINQSLSDFANVSLTPEQIILTLIGLGNDNRYNEFQSVSQGTTDDPKTHSDNTRFKSKVEILANGLQSGWPAPQSDTSS